MSLRQTNQLSNSDALIGEVALGARRALKRIVWPLVILSIVETVILANSSNPGTIAFALIAASSILAIKIWSSEGRGIPIIPLLACQNLLLYAVPIVMHDAVIGRYPAEMQTLAGAEVFVSNIAMILAWRASMAIIPAYSPLCFALQGVDSESPRLTRFGMGLLIGSTVYQTLDVAHLLGIFLNLLPSGSDSITRVIVSASSACGFFMVGIMLGRGRLSRWGRTMFWAALATQCIVSCSQFLLSASVTVIFAAVIGLFWGSGKVPWRLLLVAMAMFAILNLGKFTMRAKYWNVDGNENVNTDYGLVELPRIYTEWFGASFDAMSGAKSAAAPSASFRTFDDPQIDDEAASGQSLFARMNNLQSLLFVIDQVRTNHVKPLGGATYTLIPPLLVPRILWPTKPRTHEGQILLNVYFGRQDLRSTFTTYVAWGLLPEAYGNFGPLLGAIYLGVFVGLIFAWSERYIERKLLLSMEGFIAFTIFVGMANSYEMVASVLVTSVFQGCIPVILATTPFVERLLPKRTNVSTPSAPVA